MSRKLLAFLFGELATIRLICRRKGCGGGIVELPLAKIDLAKFETPECPLCHQKFIEAAQAHNPIFGIVQARQRLEQYDETCHVEFVLDDKSPDK